MSREGAADPRALVSQGSKKSFHIGSLGKSARDLLQSDAAERERVEASLQRRKSQQLREAARQEQEELTASSIDSLLQSYRVSPANGLSADEVCRRQDEYGPNALEKKPPTPLWRLFLEQFNDLLVILLIIAVIISAALSQVTAAVAILVIITLNAIIGVTQEYKAGNALEALESLSADRCHAIRDSAVAVVDGKDLVPGDIVQITTGMKLPADLRLLEAHNLVVSEMALTGESEGVTKDSSYVAMSVTSPTAEAREDDKEEALTSPNMVYMGCSVLDGRGLGLVCKTGMRTRMGHIAKLLNEAEAGASPLQQKLQRLGVKLGIASLAISVVVFIIGVAFNRTPTPNSPLMPWLQMLLVSVSLTVAAVPEGLPAAVTITLALGMRRMVTKHALIRNLHSVETLGSASVICSDKTGTLTAGVMTATRLWVDGATIRITGKAYDPTGEFEGSDTLMDMDAPQALPLLAAVLCSNATLRKDEATDTWECLGNTSERPLVVAAAKAGIITDNVNAEYNRVKENPFGSARKMMSTLVENSSTKPNRFPVADSGVSQSSAYIALIKGAPNIVLGQCISKLSKGRPVELTPAHRQQVMDAIDAFSSEALRVLAFAYRPFSDLPADDSEEALEKDAIFLGLIASIDPERDEVIPSIEAAKNAGIRICMITGDYVKTAKAIAENIGLLPKGSPQDMAVDCELIRGFGSTIEELERQLKDRPGDKDIKQRIDEQWMKVDAITVAADVYARAKPSDKITIVRSLQRQGNVCSMTGDGVNDAPALKQANIGVAMGITGTDVAKAAADMVLTTDDFVSIVDAIEEGRTIYANIGKFVFYLLSTNISEVFLLLFALLIGLPVPLNSVQILWLNLTDPGMMEQGPRDQKEPLIEKVMMTGIAIQTVVLTSACLGVYIFGLHKYSGAWNGGDDLLSDNVSEAGQKALRQAQSMTILLILFAELLRAHTCRSLRVSLYSMGFFSNWAMHAATISAVLLTLVWALVPWFQHQFGMEDIDAHAWGVIIGVALVPAVIDELTKAVYRHVGFGERPKHIRRDLHDVAVDVLPPDLQNSAVKGGGSDDAGIQ